VRQSTLQTPSSENEREEVIQVPELQPKQKTMRPWTVPLQLMEVHNGADIHTAAQRAPHAEAGSSQELRPVEQSPCRSRFSDRTCDPCGSPQCQQSVPEGLHPVGR